MNLTQSLPITIFLDKQAHRYALQFAGEQANPNKGKQVYLNTLAVCAVRQYLQCLSIPTNLSQSDCWHPGMRAIFDVADLVLPNIGFLECRPIFPTEETLLIPPNKGDRCLGYLAVRFTEELDRVFLLGFYPAEEMLVLEKSILLTKLQSLESLLELIHQQNQITNLRQWLDEIFHPQWEPVQALLASRQENFRTTNRNLLGESATLTSIVRGKIFTLKSNLNNNSDRLSILLIIQLGDRTSQEIDLNLQIYPFDESDNLPPELTLNLLDASGKICLNAKTGDRDNWIQLHFSCHFGEQFSLQIQWQDFKAIEQFSL
jgi:hypothetical protein